MNQLPSKLTVAGPDGAEWQLQAGASQCTCKMQMAPHCSCPANSNQHWAIIHVRTACNLSSHQRSVSQANPESVLMKEEVGQMSFENPAICASEHSSLETDANTIPQHT